MSPHAGGTDTLLKQWKEGGKSGWEGNCLGDELSHYKIARKTPPVRMPRYDPRALGIPTHAHMSRYHWVLGERKRSLLFRYIAFDCIFTTIIWHQILKQNIVLYDLLVVSVKGESANWSLLKPPASSTYSGYKLTALYHYSYDTN